MKSNWILLPSAFLIFLSGCGSNGENSSGDSGNQNSSENNVSLNLATPDPESASITVAAKEFEKRVEEESGGSIEIEVHADGSLYGGDASAAINQLGNGSMDMLALSSTVYANTDSKFSMISVPYLFNDQDEYMNLLNHDLSQELLGNLESEGIKGLNYWPRNFRQVTNSVRPINEPSDLENLKLRVPNNPLWVDYFEAAGASPVPMDFGEVYNALQTSTIDGQENPVEIPLNSNFYEVQDYLSLTNHMADAWVIGMNNEQFEQLSSDQKDIVQNASEEMQSWLREYDNEQEEEMIQSLKDEGMEVNEISGENQEKFAELSEDLYPNFKEVVGDEEYFEEVLEVINKD